MLICVYTCQKATLLEITCYGSYELRLHVPHIDWQSSKQYKYFFLNLTHHSKKKFSSDFLKIQ